MAYNWVGVTNNPATQPSTPAPVANLNVTGQPTNRWMRLAQVGAAKVAQFNILKQAASLGRDVKNLGEGVINPVTGLAKDVNKNVIQPIVKPQKSLASSSQIMRLQSQVQNLAKQGKVSGGTIKLLSQVNNPQAKIKAYQMITTGSKDSQVQQFLKTQQQAQTSKVKRVIGEGLGTVSLTVGGGEAKGLAKGAEEVASNANKAKAVLKGLKSLPKKTALIGGAGAAGNVGATLQSNPNASGKELVKSAATGYAGGVALGAGAKVAGKLLSITGRVLKRGEAQAGQQAAKEAIKVPVEHQGEATAVSVKRPNAPKLLPATASGKIQGKGFTMSGAVDKEKVALGARLNTINRQLTRVAQGKAYLHPDEVKALVKERADINSGKPPTRVVIPSSFTSDLKGMVSRGKLEPTIKIAKVDSLKLGSDTVGDELDRKTVEQYKADIKAGKPIPPLVVSKDAKGNTFVQDGAHKLQAAKELGVTDVPVVRQISKERVPGKVASTTGLKPVKVAGKTAPSQLSVKVSQQAVEHKLTEDLGDIREHTVMNIKDQAKKATDLLAKDEQRATDIATGKRNAPSGLHPHAVFVAVENKAIHDGNVDLIRELANSKRIDESTAAGQTLRVLRERDSTSPVAQIQHILDARKAATEKRLGEPITKTVTKTMKEIDSHIKAPTKSEWGSFVESLKC